MPPKRANKRKNGEDEEIFSCERPAQETGAIDAAVDPAKEEQDRKDRANRQKKARNAALALAAHKQKKRASLFSPSKQNKGGRSAKEERKHDPY